MTYYLSIFYRTKKYSAKFVEIQPTSHMKERWSIFILISSSPQDFSRIVFQEFLFFEFIILFFNNFLKMTFFEYSPICNNQIEGRIYVHEENCKHSLGIQTKADRQT